MSLHERIAEIATERGLDAFSQKRALRALGLLEEVLGPIETRDLQVPPEFGQKVMVPGDDAPYIVTGDWGDGTVDVVREQGSFPRDCLVGWRVGQSLSDYRRELDAELLPELSASPRSRPEFSSGSTLRKKAAKR